jgi:hypothetical protein
MVIRPWMGPNENPWRSRGGKLNKFVLAHSWAGVIILTGHGKGKAIIKKNLKLLWGKIRRQYLVHCRPGQVHDALANRQGGCEQCAACCRLLFRCPFLSADNLCLIYTSGLRSKSCVHFPLNRADLEDVKAAGGRVCGYHFISQ